VACEKSAGAADACVGATERGVKPANMAGLLWPRAPVLLDLEGGAEYVEGGGRAGREWCGCMMSMEELHVSSD
jgi:hypothetical protein